MLVFFVLLTIIVQVGFLVIARNAASGAVNGVVRAASHNPGDVAVLEDRLARDLAATVPGTDAAAVSVRVVGDRVVASVSFDWAPPGPDLFPVRIGVTREAVVAVAP